MILTFEQLPPRVYDYLGSTPATLKNVKFARRYKLTNEQLDAVATTIADGFLKKYPLDELPAQLKDRGHLDDSQSFLLAREIAEQHFSQFPDFFEWNDPQTLEKWSSWAHQLGAKVPETNDDGEERKVRVPGQRIRTKKPMEFTQSKSVAPRKTVGSQIVERRAQQQEAEQQQTQAQVSPEARQRFLGQIRGLTIDALRQGGQSGDAKLGQVSQKIGQVVQGAPAERMAIGQALKQSPLFSLYQQLGQEAIRAQQPIDVVIYQRYQQGQPYLLKEEFDAVANLIKQVG